MPGVLIRRIFILCTGMVGERDVRPMIIVVRCVCARPDAMGLHQCNDRRNAEREMAFHGRLPLGQWIV
jgi:hypothetical protein